jgi:hypothetical protein
LVIALTHHLLHMVLDHYAPSSRSPGMTRTEGVLPTLMSWWEGFYGWMAIALAVVVSSSRLGRVYKNCLWQQHCAENPPLQI